MVQSFRWVLMFSAITLYHKTKSLATPFEAAKLFFFLFGVQQPPFGGGRWIRTIEARSNRFTVCPLWPLGNSPIIHPEYFPNECNWSWWTDLNPRPADYKSAALPTELHQLIIINGIPWRRLSPDDLIIISQLSLNVNRNF